MESSHSERGHCSPGRPRAPFCRGDPARSRQPRWEALSPSGFASVSSPFSPRLRASIVRLSASIASFQARLQLDDPQCLVLPREAPNTGRATQHTPASLVLRSPRRTPTRAAPPRRRRRTKNRASSRDDRGPNLPYRGFLRRGATAHPGQVAGRCTRQRHNPTTAFQQGPSQSRSRDSRHPVATVAATATGRRPPPTS